MKARSGLEEGKISWYSLNYVPESIEEWDLFLHDIMSVRLQLFCSESEIWAVKEVMAQITKADQGNGIGRKPSIFFTRRWKVAVVLCWCRFSDLAINHATVAHSPHQSNPKAPTSDSPQEPWPSAALLHCDHFTPPTNINIGMLFQLWSSVHDENGWERQKPDPCLSVLDPSHPLW